MNKIKWIVLISFIIVINIVIISISLHQDEKIEKIPDNYIAAFKAEDAETVKTTYLYQKKSGKKIKYQYVNTIITTDPYDDTITQEKIVKTGKLKKKKDIFKIAKKHGAYSYVRIKEDDNIHSIEELEGMWK